MAADVLKPTDEKDVAAAVKAALAGAKTLEILGHGSKRSIGRPAQWDFTLDLSGLTGVTLYEPEELVLSARAGTPLSEIEALVAGHGQELAFEPMDCGPLLGGPPGRGTIAGALAANLSGPRRIKAGAARDHFLGASAVSGRGEIFKSGGRVVKNVTGYDLCKVLAGSWGTLAAMTEVTIKVLPRAETEETLLVLGLNDLAAVRAMAAAMGSSGEVSAAGHLPASVARRVPDVARAGIAATAFRLEGVAPSITHRRHILEALLKPLGPLVTLGEVGSRALWRAFRDVAPLASGTGPLWRISTVPSLAPEVAARIAAAAEAEFLYDWAGGLVWVALASAEDAGARLIRGAMGEAGGHATLVRARVPERATVEVFEPQAPALAMLAQRVKQSFDPAGVLGPGRMYAGI